MTDILVVDDDENMRQALAEALTRAGYRVETAADASAGMMKLEMGEFRLVVSDLRMPKKNGLEFLDEIKALRPALPVVLITAYGAMETAVEAMRRGAADYLLKPFSADTLEKTVKRLLEGEGGESAKAAAPARPAVRATRAKERPIVTKNKKMLEMLEMAERTAASRASVLIQGESGTGKELLARFIHQKSDRAQGPFVAINCAAIPETLLESELFGHEKGAFTGAHERKIGLLEHAHNGTVFLDEVGELDVNLQKKLLRFLQEREILRVGGTGRIKLNVRIIAATNKDLEEEIQQKRFREDLFYRLNVVTIKMPPLRERKEDIPLLANHFLDRLNQIEGKLINGFEDNVMAALMMHDWPGNVRELENVVERAYVLCPNITINLKYLPERLISMAEGNRESLDQMNLLETEKRLIVKALNGTSWNQSKAAEVLGITRKQLRTKMQHHNLLPA